MITFFKKMLHSCSGATAIEYGLLAALISVSSITAISSTGTNLNNTFDCVSATMNSESCVGGVHASGTTSSDGWNGEIPVKAGETYEITFDPNMDYTVWNSAKEWFDPSRGIGAVITDTKLSDMGIDYIKKDGKSRGRVAGSTTFSNISFHEDGKLTITAQNDGFMNIGINDVNGSDNWVTYDGGATKSQNMNYTVTRIE